MEKDHLDKETSVSAEITASGINAGAKSRFVAAVDRLGGALVDVVSAHVEGHASRRRAKTESEVDVIKAITQYGVEHLGSDPARAERAFQKHFQKVLREQENSDAVLREALEDLSSNPPDEASSANETELSEDFLDRLEHYSAAASTDELRKRWGRVLASEIRRPGTASRKVLRLIDELNSGIALKFESIAKYRIGKILPKALVGELDYVVETNLFISGLIIGAGMGGQIVYFSEVEDGKGGKSLSLGFGRVGALSIPRDSKIAKGTEILALTTNIRGEIGVTCYVLTDEGEAIANILPDLQQEALAAYAAKIAEDHGIKARRFIR